MSGPKPKPDSDLLLVFILFNIFKNLKPTLFFVEPSKTRSIWVRLGWVHTNQAEIAIPIEMATKKPIPKPIDGEIVLLVIWKSVLLS